MATFSAYAFTEMGGDLVKIEKPLVDPEPYYVRIRVHFCGLCHSDVFTKFGAMGNPFPRIPGHEVAGVVDAVGPNVTKWKPGDRVGVGWFGGCCHVCGSCREGDLILCDTMPVTGIHYDGGYGEYVYSQQDALAAIPEELTFAEAAPLMCAGVTTYNGLRSVRAPQGATVGVHGIGGLGHLGIQFARKMGYKVFAFSRGKDKEELCLKLGAHKYFDTTDADFVAQVQAAGGVDVVLATSTNPAAMTQGLQTLAKNGTCVVLGAGQENIEVSPLLLIGGRRKVQGFPSGQASDSEDAMKFAALSGVRSMNEVFPVENVKEAFERMMSNKANFRVIIDWHVTA